MKVNRIEKFIILLALALLVTMTLAPSVNAAAGQKWGTSGAKCPGTLKTMIL